MFRGFIYSDLQAPSSSTTATRITTPSTASATSCAPPHRLRDLEDAAQPYPDAIWPAQIARELRALIHAANVARDKGLAAVPDEMTAGHLELFRSGVDAGLSQVRRIPGGKNVKQPACTCWNASGTARPTCCGS